MARSFIKGIGSYVPPKVVTNDDLAKIMPTSHEWIVKRTGIEERRVAQEGVFCSDLALEACKKAIRDADLEVSDIQFIIFATLSPDHHFPGSACYLQPKLGLENVGCLDVRNQCTGFLYSLAIADAFVRVGAYDNILVVGSEVHSSALEYNKRGRAVAVLFGDGAAATVVSRCGPEQEKTGSGVLDCELHADGRYAKALHLDVWDISKKPYLTPEDTLSEQIWPQMDGGTVFKHAVRRLVEVILSTLERNSINARDIKYVIPHQANMRINQFVAKMLEMPEEKFLHNMQRYGNTTAASIPLLLDETYRKGNLEKGDLLLLIAFGAGFTWGSALLRW